MNERDYSSSRVASAVAALIGEPAAQRLLGRLGGILVVHSSELAPTGSAASFKAAKSGMRASAAELMPAQAAQEDRAAQAFYSPATDTIVLVEDRIAKGDETAVYLHEVVHRRGRKAIGQEGWDRLVERVKGWEQRPEGSIERQVQEVAFSRAKRAVGEGHRHFFEEFFAYSVEEAVRLGVKPNLAAIEDSAEQWLGDVVVTLQSVIFQSTQSMVNLDAQQIVNLAYALAQLENPDRSEQILRALAKGQDRSAPPAERPLKKDVLGFYSALARGVSALPTKRATGPAWEALLRGLRNKGLVKQDEITWSGLEDWLSLQQGRVSQEQVLEYLSGNGVQVQELVLGQPNEEDIQSLLSDEAGEGMTREDAIEYLGKDEGATPAKYSQYALPGGENYREVLLTLPVKSRDTSGYTAELVSSPDDMGLGEWQVMNGDRFVGNPVIAYKNENAIQTAVNRENRENPAGYKSSHWDAPNVLAHIRVNDRVDADGNRVLFVEEIQSDFGQETKKKGAAMTRAEFDALPKEDQAFAIGETRNMGLPPAAPFAGNTQGWLNLALKRIITMAVDGGYDKVAFVTGAQSAERYDLSKQVDKIVWNERTGDLAAQRSGGDTGTIKHKDVTREKLADLIGKDPAERLINSKDLSGWRSIEGADLKVGGDGMIAFYDKIVPNAVRALLKKVGGGQLEKINIGESNGGMFAIMKPDGSLYTDASGVIRYPSKAKATAAAVKINRSMGAGHKAAEAPKSGGEQPGFVITPSMRERVADGLPLFSRADIEGTDNFKNWFGASKAVDVQGKPLVLYHGTIIRPDSAKVKSMGDINAFDRLFTTQFRRPSVDTVGVWFSTNPGDGGAGMYAGNGEGSVIYPVHLSIKNPQETTFELLLRRARLLQNGEDDGRMIGEAEVNAYRKWLEDMGKDGIKIVHDEWAVNGSTEFKDQGVWIALHPEQIKSAIGNCGTYESTNPDILCSLAEHRSDVDIVSALGGNASPATGHLPQWWAAGRPVGDGMEALEKASGDAPYILDPAEDADKRWRIADVPIDLVLDSGIAPEPHRLQERLDAIRAVESPERPIFELGQDGMVRILDGWHRLQVAKERGQTTVSALVGLGDVPAPPSQSEVFRRWFGASVVVGLGGEPLVVYRGDKPNKTVFTGREDPSNIIQGDIFFSSKPAIAKFYTRHRTDYVTSPADLGPADGLYRVYLSLQNPLIVDAGGEDWCGIPSPFEPDGRIQIDDLALEAQKRGYDGLFVRDVWDQAGNGDQYVVFSPEQIKSSADNNGAFDCESPDILMSEMPGEQGAEDEAVEPVVDEHSFMRSRCG